MRLFLASRSPARKRLLQKAGFEVIVVTPADDDSLLFKTDDVEKIVLSMAEEKLRSVLPHLREADLCVAADTLVVCNGKILSKPKDEKEARQMLGFISGKSQRVVTGLSVALVGRRLLRGWMDAECEMAHLTDKQISDIINKGLSIGVSGGYAIDENGNDPYCRILKGELSTVVGLPLNLLRKFLNELGVV